MSQSNSRNGSAVFGDEDNSPFSHSDDVSGINTDTSSSHPEILNETASQLKDRKLSDDIHDSSGLIKTLSVPDHSSSGLERASDTEDQESLLFCPTDRETYNAVNINHESRVVKVLSSESLVEVQISEAGKSNEGMTNSLKKYIVYTIKLLKLDDNKEEIQTRRRYSDFESLRDILNRIFPLVVIPPIPPKNYFSFNVWNGLVGSNGTSSPTNQESSHHENGSLPGTLNAYSYINSKHLNKSRLIEHRKRLLANFLNNCLKIRQVRNLSFFAKFLDPTANWSDEVTLIQSQLPKLIYQLNPENGLNTEEIYASLPLPVSNNALGFSLLKANKLAQKTSRLLGNATSDIVHAATPAREDDADRDDSISESANNTDTQILRPSSLDDINKKIITNLMGLSNDYVDLGVALNLISLGVLEPSKSKIDKDSDLGDNTKLDFIFDKIGSAFDRSYLTLNSLMAELETKFSEPLGEAVQFTAVLNSVRKFQDRKSKQQVLVDNELKEKKKELADKMRIEIDFAKNPGSTQSNSSSGEPKSRGGFMSKMAPLKKLSDYVSNMIDQTPELTRKERIGQLQKRIAVLEKCQKIMLEDIAYITCELDKNQENFKEKEFATILRILQSYHIVFISWAKKNMEIWEEIKEEIERTEF